MKILIIEDERAVAHVVSQALREAGWEVEWASDGESGLKAALEGEFGVVVLDVMLPGRSGWDIVRELREQKPAISILMTSALDDVSDRVRGLQIGADDYLAKPFELAELVARVESLIRRDHLSRDLVTKVGDLVLDRKTRNVSRQGRPVRLTRREYDLLEALASNEGVALDRETLQNRVWTDNEAFGQTVDVFIGTLRKKVDEPFGHPLIHTSGRGEFWLADEALVKIA